MTSHTSTVQYPIFPVCRGVARFTTHHMLVLLRTLQHPHARPRLGYAVRHRFSSSRRFPPKDDDDEQPMSEINVPMMPNAIHTMAGVVGGFVPPLVGWSLLSASGAGVAAGVVLDLSCQLAWNTMMIARTVQQHRKRAEAGASARAAIGVTFGPTLAAAGFAAVTVLARYSYEKYYAAPTLSPLADFADARSVWALERRVDEQQRAIELLRQEVATLHRQPSQRE